MREALRHFLLENQMSHASYTSHTSHPKANCKEQRSYQTNLTTKERKQKMKTATSPFIYRGEMHFRVQKMGKLQTYHPAVCDNSLVIASFWPE